jgi:hypothetical protein
MTKAQQAKVGRYLKMGYVEHCMVHGVAILIRSDTKSGQAVFKDGESVHLRSPDVHRFLNKEVVNMKRYTKKQLEGKTTPELVALYNERAEKPVKKFGTKKMAVSRVLAQQPSKATTKEPALRISDKPSKKQLSLAIYEDGIKRGLSRKEIMEKFVNDVGVAPGGASSYYQHCRRLSGAV